jgi:hypothetical protein
LHASCNLSLDLGSILCVDLRMDCL